MSAVAASGGGEKSIRITRNDGKATGGSNTPTASTEETDWVPELTEMERPDPRTKTKPKGGRKEGGKKEKWSRAKKNAAKNKRSEGEKKRKTDDRSKSPAPKKETSSSGNQALKRRQKKSPESD